MATPDIPLWLLAPFALLLLLMAAMPLTPPRGRHAWERFHPHVAIALGALVAVYYLARMPGGATAVGHALHDYVSFIALLGSLFVVAGGIHLQVKGEATPAQNVVFLAVGALLANVIGTTGASLVLIRPWIRLNKIRASAFHVVFFIFIVSNLGGALTPIGDPPLLLGYLRGVPFFWLVGRVLAPWLCALGLVLLAFYCHDRRSLRRLPRPLQAKVAGEGERWSLAGRRNVLLLLVVVGALFLPDVFFARELVMLGAAAASLRLTPKRIHEENAFTFAPFREVAFLFFGLFATMLPALGYLEQHGAAFGFTRPLQYYFGAGALSAVLDNAPTYVSFLQLAQATALAAGPAAHADLSGPQATAMLLASQPLFVVAVSLGSVFFGAMTYIGNGPNFMVRAIAHDAGVHCPTFPGYMLRFSLPILLPILVLVGWLFL